MNAFTKSLPSIRVALFSGNYNYIRDGANQALNRLVEYLERTGAAVRVYSPTSDWPAFQHAGDLVSVPSIPMPGRNEYRLALGLPNSIKRDLHRFNPTLFHLSAPDYLGYQAQILARQWGVPVVASVHTRFEMYFRYYGLAWMEGCAKRYLRHFYGRCAQIYAPTESMADTLRADGMSHEIRRWGRGVDTHLYNPSKRDMTWRRSMGISDNEFVIAFVGRIVREKGLGMFADTIDILRASKSTLRVLVVGEGPEMSWFKARLPRDVFTGFLEGENLAKAYASADAFFNPSTTETFGNVTLEAMASGCAVVCAQATGSVSLVADNATGLVAKYDDANEYAYQLARLVDGPELRLSLGSNARRRSLLYDWDSILEEVVANYRDVQEAHVARLSPAARSGKYGTSKSRKGSLFGATMSGTGRELNPE